MHGGRADRTPAGARGALRRLLLNPLRCFGCRGIRNGAGNRDRTGDLNLGKVALYQLSYSRLELAVGPAVALGEVPSPAGRNAAACPGRAAVGKIMASPRGVLAALARCSPFGPPAEAGVQGALPLVEPL